MSQELLEKLVTNGKRHADEILIKRRDKELSPLFHLVSRDGQQDAVMVTPWANDIQKQLAVAEVKHMAHKIDAIAACFITEAWMLKVDAKGIPNTPWHRDRLLDSVGRPSQSPNRVEVVMIIARDPEGNTATASLQIVRDKPGGRIIALVEDHDMPGHYESWMFDGMFNHADDV